MQVFVKTIRYTPQTTLLSAQHFPYKFILLPDQQQQYLNVLVHLQLFFLCREVKANTKILLYESSD